MTLRKREARPGLQIAFKTQRLRFIPEVDAYLDQPWPPSSCVSAFTGVMRDQSSTDVRRHATVVMGWLVFSLEDVHARLGLVHKAGRVQAVCPELTYDFLRRFARFVGALQR